VFFSMGCQSNRRYILIAYRSWRKTKYHILMSRPGLDINLTSLNSTYSGLKKSPREES
jgi:hypothetical protein